MTFVGLESQACSPVAGRLADDLAVRRRESTESPYPLVIHSYGQDIWRLRPLNDAVLRAHHPQVIVRSDLDTVPNTDGFAV